VSQRENDQVQGWWRLDTAHVEVETVVNLEKKCQMMEIEVMFDNKEV
jgi:hypothetical protein